MSFPTLVDDLAHLPHGFDMPAWRTRIGQRRCGVRREPGAVVSLRLGRWGIVHGATVSRARLTATQTRAKAEVGFFLGAGGRRTGVPVRTPGLLQAHASRERKVAREARGLPLTPPASALMADAMTSNLAVRRGRPEKPMRLGGFGYSSPIRSAAMKASWGMLTLPYSRIRFLPSFCFSSSFFLRLMSPP